MSKTKLDIIFRHISFHNKFEEELINRKKYCKVTNFNETMTITIQKELFILILSAEGVAPLMIAPM